MRSNQNLPDQFSKQAKAILNIEQLSEDIGKSVTTIRNCVSNSHLHHLIPRPLPRGQGSAWRLQWDSAVVDAWKSKNIIAGCGEEYADVTLFTSERAAAFLDTSEHVLRMSRSTGVLWGNPAPRFIKRGSAVRYRLQDLRRYVESLPLFSSTAEAGAALRQEAAR